MLPCPSPAPEVCSNSCPLSQWWHPTISSSVIPFSSCLQSFPASGSFQWVSSSHQVAKVLELQLQYQSFQWKIRTNFPLDWLVWVFSKTTVQKHQFFGIASILWHSAFFMEQYSHPYVNTRKTIALTKWPFVGKVMSLLFNMLSRLVITFLPRSKCLLLSWLYSPSAVILEPKKVKSVTAYTFCPSICHEVMGLNAMIFVFWMLSFKPAFSVSSFIFINRLFSSSSLSAIWWCHLHIWGYWYFSWQSWFQLVLHPAWHFAWCAYKLNK